MDPDNSVKPWRSDRLRSSPALLALTALFAVLAGAGIVLTSASAWADIVPVPQPDDGFLVANSRAEPGQVLTLSPGSPAYWPIDLSLTDATLSSLTVEVRKGGDLVDHPRGLRFSLRRCDAPWTDSTPVTCPGGSTEVLRTTPVHDYSTESPTWDLDGLQESSGKFVVVTLWVENSPAARADESLMGLSASIALGFEAAAVDPAPDPTPTGPGPTPIAPSPTPSGLSPTPSVPSPTPSGPVTAFPGLLPVTGADALPLLLLGLGFGGLGIVATILRRRGSAAARDTTRDQ